MKKNTTWSLVLITFLLLMILLVLGVFWHWRRGTGSYWYARKWQKQLAACNSIEDVRQQFNCARWQRDTRGSLTYIRDPNTVKRGRTWALLHNSPNGDWIAMAYASSHNAWGGGTVVARDNTGNIRVFFGHVCGRPFSRGESLEEVYAGFSGSDWKEVSLEE